MRVRKPASLAFDPAVKSALSHPQRQGCVAAVPTVTKQGLGHHAGTQAHSAPLAGQPTRPRGRSHDVCRGARPMRRHRRRQDPGVQLEQRPGNRPLFDWAAARVTPWRNSRRLPGKSWACNQIESPAISPPKWGPVHRALRAAPLCHPLSQPSTVTIAECHDKPVCLSVVTGRVMARWRIRPARLAKLSPRWRGTGGEGGIRTLGTGIPFA